MPQASEELRAKFPGWDKEALDILDEAGYTIDKRFCIIIPKDREPTEREWEAIDYLIFEWDYGCRKEK